MIMNTCVICKSHEPNLQKINGKLVCSDCLEKIILRYKDIMLKFYEYLKSRNSLEKNQWLNDFYDRINNNDFWDEKFQSSSNVIVDYGFIFGLAGSNFDTFAFIKEFIDINYITTNEWNDFLDSYKDSVMGVRYYKCEKCGIFTSELETKFVQIGTMQYCNKCYEHALKLHQKLVIDFLDFVKVKTGKIETDELKLYYSKDDNIYNEFYKIEKFDINIEKDNCNGKFLYFLLRRKFGGDRVLALWNSFLKETEYKGKRMPFYIPGACKRCHKSEAATANKGYDYYATIFYDQNFLCAECKRFLEILNDLYEEYGWNPKWRTALKEFNKISVEKHEEEANPKTLYSILKKYNIELSSEIFDFWNNLYSKYGGNGIIKLYSIPNGVGGEIQQQVGRFLGGFSKFFK